MIDVIKRRAYQRAYIKSGKGLEKNRRSARLRGRAGELSAAESGAIMNLFQGKCAYCGESQDVTFDHIVPIVNGGKSVPENMVPCCLRCNKSKKAETWIPGAPDLPSPTEAERFQAWNQLVGELRLERLLEG